MKIVVKSRKRKRSSAATRDGAPIIFKKAPKPSASSSEAPLSSSFTVNPPNSGTDGRNDNVEDEEFPPLPEGAADDVPADALLSLRSLVQRRACAFCPPASKADSSLGAPFVLRDMIHYALRSRGVSSGGNAESDGIMTAQASTGVSVELDGLAREGKIRLVQLHGLDDAPGGGGFGGGGGVAVMECADYVGGCWDALDAHAAASADDEESTDSAVPAATGAGLPVHQKRPVMERFVSSLHLWTRTSVSHKELSDAFARPFGESALDWLLTVGLLLPKRDRMMSLRDVGGISSCALSYWFTLPKMGPAARAITMGRTKLLARLRRSSYGEIRRSVLESSAGSSSTGGRGGKKAEIVMSGAFHVRDLLANGAVGVRDRPSGQFICVRGSN